MDLQLLFWVLYIITLILSCWMGWPDGAPTRATMRPLGGALIVYILIGILGWAVFGPAIHR
jgi:hypothetical protein